MSDQQTGVVVTLAVVGGCYAVIVFATFRHVTNRMPAGIVRRLVGSGRPVTLTLGTVSSGLWDPSRPFGAGGFYGPGSVTYTLDDQNTVRARFQPRSGSPVERAGRIPPAFMPEAPETHRRRVIARLVISLYVAIGAVSFGVTAAVVDGTRSLRIRVAALVALGTVAVAWLLTHLVLTRRRSRRARAEQTVETENAAPRPSRHVLAWVAGYIIVSTAFVVAWRIGNLDQPHPMSWASAFLSAAIFVFLTGAMLAASVHHHTYIHHSEGERRSD